jgi:NADPH2:quinone reductase
MAGPCSVEDEATTRAAAEAVARAGGLVLRGGAFKPRTSPHVFQGLGLEGLQILRAAADEFGLAVITEALGVEHVEAVCEHADIIQIGSRNMQHFPLLWAVGEGVTDLKVGDRVAYVLPLGCYAEERLAPADRSVKLPDNISFDQAAAMMLKGMTVSYLLKRTFKVQKGHNVLIHAAAGGVGLIACQWANSIGANVIGTVGSKDKAELAKANGCHHTILYRDENWVERVGQITNGAKCEVVYDGVGNDTFPGSLDCLKPLGMFVSYGSASGPVKAFDINILQHKGSLFATRPTLNTYAAKRTDLLDIANDLFAVVGSGAVKIPINQKYALKDARKAHEDLEGRKTTGASILVP